MTSRIRMFPGGNGRHAQQSSRRRRSSASPAETFRAVARRRGAVRLEFRSEHSLFQFEFSSEHSLYQSVPRSYPFAPIQFGLRNCLKTPLSLGRGAAGEGTFGFFRGQPHENLFPSPGPRPPAPPGEGLKTAADGRALQADICIHHYLPQGVHTCCLVDAPSG